MATAEFCECGSKCPGYLSLRDPLNTFVCGRCMKPSLLVWLASERFCEECGVSIYTRWEVVCSSCQTVIFKAGCDGQDWALSFNLGQRVQSDGTLPWIGWAEAKERSINSWPYRWSTWPDAA